MFSSGIQMKSDEIHNVHYEQSLIENGVVEHTFHFLREDNTSKLKNYLVEWEVPVYNFAAVWHLDCGLDRAIRDIRIETMSSRFAPVMCFYDTLGKNQYTFCVSETKQRTKVHAIVSEETGFMNMRVEVDDVGLKDYTLSIREDRRQLPYYESLRQVSLWWEKNPFVKKNEDIWNPMYSTWYVWHQNLDSKILEDECRRAAAMGMKTIITDDGWQTEDNHRGYAYCGDWEVQESRFPDFRAHVEKIHQMGMKYMIWFSVPFVGKHSKAWKRFQNKLLSYEEEMGAGVLDPRYPEVREYLKDIYVNHVKEYHLDGLKLDFIDQFYLRENSPAYQEEMDFSDVQDAVDCLMHSVRDALTEVNPDIMIEFRQPYMGPKMREYGNMFRAADCPYSELTNRVRTIDLRLLSGDSAVHSDMLMWHPDDSDEAVSRQIIAGIFSVMQFSVNLGMISESKKRILSHWIPFMKENKDLLLHSQLRPQEPQHLYPEVTAEDGENAIVALYSANRVIELCDAWKSATILNGTDRKRIYVRCGRTGDYTVQVLDCYGDQKDLQNLKWKAGSIYEINVTTGGTIHIQQNLY